MRTAILILVLFIAAACTRPDDDFNISAATVRAHAEAMQ